jgi:DNA-binding NarL/FixJ family response regulator
MSVDDVPAESIGVLVVDDHAHFRDGVAALLATVPDIHLSGEASNGEEALVRAGDVQPDVVLMDINMAGIDGIETTRAIVSASPHIAVVVLTMFDDYDLVFAALKAGARGYLLKGASRSELVRGIRTAAAGGAVFGPEVARRLIGYFSARPAIEADLFPELTARERETLEMMARGLPNQAIADRLGVAPKTVRNNVSNIFAKLQVRDRAEAIVKAREAGLGGERHDPGTERSAIGHLPGWTGHRPRDDGTLDR